MPAPTLYPPARPQSIGEVLDQAFEIFRRTLLGCLPYGVVLVLCAQLARIEELSRGAAASAGLRGDRLDALCYIAGALLAVLTVSALLLRQRALAAGESSSRLAELRVALLRFPGTLLLSLLGALILGLASAGLIMLFRATGVQPGSPAGSLAGSLAFLLVLPSGFAFVVAALSAACGLLLPNLLLRPVGPLEAIRWTVRLLRGNFWRTALIFVVAAFLMLAFYGAALLLSSLLLALLRMQDVVVASAILAVILLAVSAIVVPFYCAVLLTTFADLRARREGLDLEHRIATAAGP